MVQITSYEVRTPGTQAGAVHRRRPPDFLALGEPAKNVAAYRARLDLFAEWTPIFRAELDEITTRREKELPRSTPTSLAKINAQITEVRGHLDWLAEVGAHLEAQLPAMEQAEADCQAEIDDEAARLCPHKAEWLAAHESFAPMLTAYAKHLAEGRRLFGTLDGLRRKILKKQAEGITLFAPDTGAALPKAVVETILPALDGISARPLYSFRVHD